MLVAGACAGSGCGWLALKDGSSRVCQAEAAVLRHPPSLSQGVLTVLVGNLFTLVPLVCNAHPGTKYGLPFPVLARAAFGIKVC